MSFDIPATIEPEIMKYAKARQITSQEAIVMLIETGLGTEAHRGNVILDGLGMFSGVDDAGLLDDAVSIAYDERRRPSTIPG